MAVSLSRAGSGPAWLAPARGVATRPALLRALLLAGSALAAAVSISLGAPEARLAADVDLAFLLRGMAVIKAGLVVAAAGVLWWRFGHPIGRSTAAAYLLGVCLMTAAAGLVWQLTLIPTAALAFHVGGFLLLFTAYRDRDALPLRAPNSRPRS